MVVGNPETKKLSDVMTDSDFMAALSAAQKAQAAAGGADDDDVPDLVSGVNFQNVATAEAK